MAVWVLNKDKQSVPTTRTVLQNRRFHAALEHHGAHREAV